MSLSEFSAAPFVVAAGLLVVSGSSKLGRPEPAVRSLEGAGLPSGRAAVRLLGSFEVAVGAACLLLPGPASAALLALAYAGFAAFLIRMMRADGPARSCGCVGDRDTPPSVLHLGLNILAAASGVVAAVSVPPGVVDMVARSPMFGVPVLLGLFGSGYAAYAAIVYVPRAWGSYRPHVDHEDRGAPNVFRLEPFRSRREARA
jgi:uncharacterized membrane protein YphA (DoxX/SURF4 family)